LRPAPQTCSSIRGGFFRPTNRGCRPWSNSWVQRHLRRNSLKRLTRRRKHLRRGPASRRIHELVQLGENLPADEDRKIFGCHFQTAAIFQIRFMRGRVLYLNVRFGSLYGLSPRPGSCPSGHSRRLSRSRQITLRRTRLNLRARGCAVMRNRIIGPAIGAGFSLTVSCRSYPWRFGRQ